MLADPDKLHLGFGVRAQSSPDVNVPGLLPPQSVSLATGVEDLPHGLGASAVDVLLAREVFALWGGGEGSEGYAGSEES